MLGTGSSNLGVTDAGENDPLNSLSSSVTFTTPTLCDPRIPLLNLSLLSQKMDSLRRFLSDSVDCGVPIDGGQLQFVAGEIASTVQQVIINGSALLPASSRVSHVAKPSHPLSKIDLKPAERSGSPFTRALPAVSLADADAEIIEIDAGELMAEHVHFCEFCGKGFRRDANLRMHMRAHGDRFKTIESLIKPDSRMAGWGIGLGRQVRFSCPLNGCRRNRNHTRFRPLKTAVCIRNHFRRSHCPKMFTCDVCNKKSFSVIADLKSHRKSCGESQWRCSCGTCFSRKDKLFGHVALFDGHFPVVATGEEEKGKGVVVGGNIEGKKGGQAGVSLDDGFFDGLIDEIEGMVGGWKGI